MENGKRSVFRRAIDETLDFCKIARLFSTHTKFCARDLVLSLTKERSTSDDSVGFKLTSQIYCASADFLKISGLAPARSSRAVSSFSFVR